MFTQQLTVLSILWSTCPVIPAFMAIDKLHLLPIHSLMLLFDHFTVGQFSQCCLPTLDQVWKTFCLDSWASLCQAILYLLLVIFYMYLIIFANTFQIQTKYQIQIYAFLWFSLQIKKNSVFKYKCKYVFEPNPVSHDSVWLFNSLPCFERPPLHFDKT